MSKDDAIFSYKTSMAVFEGWRRAGLITREEYLSIDTIMANKYGLSSCSIYREPDLKTYGNRVIYGSTEGDAYGKNSNQD